MFDKVLLYFRKKLSDKVILRICTFCQIICNVILGVLFFIFLYLWFGLKIFQSFSFIGVGLGLGNPSPTYEPVYIEEPVEVYSSTSPVKYTSWQWNFTHKQQHIYTTSYSSSSGYTSIAVVGAQQHGAGLKDEFETIELNFYGRMPVYNPDGSVNIQAKDIYRFTGYAYAPSAPSISNPKSVLSPVYYGYSDWQGNILYDVYTVRTEQLNSSLSAELFTDISGMPQSFSPQFALKPSSSIHFDSNNRYYISFHYLLDNPSSTIFSIPNPDMSWSVSGSGFMKFTGTSSSTQHIMYPCNYVLNYEGAQKTFSLSFSSDFFSLSTDDVSQFIFYLVDLNASSNNSPLKFHSPYYTDTISSSMYVYNIPLEYASGFNTIARLLLESQVANNLNKEILESTQNIEDKVSNGGDKHNSAESKNDELSTEFGKFEEINDTTDAYQDISDDVLSLDLSFLLELSATASFMNSLITLFWSSTGRFEPILTISMTVALLSLIVGIRCVKSVSNK